MQAGKELAQERHFVVIRAALRGIADAGDAGARAHAYEHPVAAAVHFQLKDLEIRDDDARELRGGPCRRSQSQRLEQAAAMHALHCTKEVTGS